LSFADWFVLGSYVAMLVGIAVFQKRTVKARDDLFLAGRSMSRWPVAISMYVALFSSNTLIGVIGWLNRPDGTIWIGLQNIGIILAVPLAVWLYPDIFFRLRITTAYEYLERRFDYPVRAVSSGLFIASRVMWMATMLYGGSLVATQITGLRDSLAPAVVSLMFVAAILSMIGGMRAVIWTDVAQFFVLFGSVLLMAVLAISKSGGVEQMVASAAEAGRFTRPPLFSASDDLSIMSGLFLGLVGMLSSVGTDQVVLQTYLTSKNVKAARDSLWFNGLILKPLSLMFPLLGVIIFVYFRTHPDDRALMRLPDDALPVFIVQVLPAGARGLALAGIMAALLTSLQGGLAALAACVQVDYLQRWMRPLNDAGAVRLGRALMAGWGVMITIAALGVIRLGRDNSIIQILNKVMYPFTGVLLGIFLLGLLTRRASGGATLAGAIGGLLLTLYLPLGGVAVSNFYFGIIATASTFALGWCFSLLGTAPEASKVDGLSHAS
jgi:SSS family transporter